MEEALPPAVAAAAVAVVAQVLRRAPACYA